MSILKFLPCLFIAASHAIALAPSTILFQGTMVKNKVALTGKHSLTVHLCPTSDVTELTGCESVYSSTNVLFNEGYYSVLLGESTALPTFDQQWYLHISVDGTTPEVRAPLTSAPSALYATKAGTAENATMADAAKKLATNATASTLTASGKITAKSFAYSSDKSLILDVPVASMAINKAQSNVNWITSAWSLGFACPSAGASMGTLTSSYIVNIPDGAIIDSVAVIANDRVAFPIEIWIDVGDLSGVEMEKTIIDLGSTPPKTTWTKYGTVADRYRKKVSAVTTFANHVVNKSKYIYRFTIARFKDPSVSCINAGEYDFTIERAQIFYHVNDL